jgi:hypothetical protein
MPSAPIRMQLRWCELGRHQRPRYAFDTRRGQAPDGLATSCRTCERDAPGSIRAQRIALVRAWERRAHPLHEPDAACLHCWRIQDTTREVER